MDKLGGRSDELNVSVVLSFSIILSTWVISMCDEIHIILDTVQFVNTKLLDSRCLWFLFYPQPNMNLKGN